MPNTWNPQLYYGFGVPPHPLTASQSNSATTTQSVGAPFTPVGLLPQSAVNSECICSAANSATNAPIVTGPTPTISSTNTAAQLAADPVLLHQFVQTQQMLINSVCQCNQMLWHQQREIDALNNTIHVVSRQLMNSIQYTNFYSYILTISQSLSIVTGTSFCINRKRQHCTTNGFTLLSACRIGAAAWHNSRNIAKQSLFEQLKSCAIRATIALYARSNHNYTK